MATADKCISILKEDPTLFEDYVRLLQNFRSECMILKNIRLLGSELKNRNFIYDIDLGKLVFQSNSLGMEFGEILLKQYKIQLEMSTKSHSIAMTSVADTKEGFDRLFHALVEIDKKHEEISCIKNTVTQCCHIPPRVYSPRESVRMKRKKVSIEESKGHVSAENIIPYPPGIPIITAGELITQDIVDLLLGREDFISILM